MSQTTETPTTMPGRSSLPADLVLGHQVFRLLVTSSDWIWRRVERVSFLDAVSYRHDHLITIDPPKVPNPAPRVAQLHLATQTQVTPTYLPVAVLAKALVSDFSVRGGSGDDIAWLPRQYNDWVTWSALVAAAQGVIYATRKGAGEEIQPEIVDRLYEIATADVREAVAIRRELREQAKRADRHDQLSRLMNHDVFARLLADLSRNWLLLIPTPQPTGILTPESTGPTRISVSYINWIRWGPRTGKSGDSYTTVYLPPHAVRPPPRQSDEPILNWAAEYIKWVRWRQYLRMSWLEAAAAFPTPSFQDCRSFHFQVESPPGLHVTRTKLIYRHLDDARDSVSGVGGGHVGHVYSRSIPFARKAKVRVGLVPIGRGLIRYAAIAGVTSAVILTVGLFFLSRLHAPGTVASGAILLVVPGIALSSILRPDQHEMAAYMYVGVKICVFISAMCLYLAALVLNVHLGDTLLLWSWIVLCGASWVSAWFLSKSYLTPRRFLADAALIPPDKHMERDQGEESNVHEPGIG